MIVFTPKKECVENSAQQHSDVTYEFEDCKEDDDEIEKTEQIFNFVDTPSYISIFLEALSNLYTSLKLQRKELHLKMCQIQMVILLLLVKNVLRDIT